MFVNNYNSSVIYSDLIFFAIVREILISSMNISIYLIISGEDYKEFFLLYLLLVIIIETVVVIIIRI